MSRVKYDAKADYEYLENFKILQACFKRNGVEKVSCAPLYMVGRADVAANTR
jgi:hypothetical protein